MIIQIWREISIVTMWKLRLSSKGTMTLNFVLFLSQVMVFRQTGSKISAMFNFSVSAAPLAMQTQWPITWYAALFRYCTNLYANNPNITPTHRAIIQTLRQLSFKRYLVPWQHLINGLFSSAGRLSCSLSNWLRFLLSPLVVCFEASNRTISSLCTCSPDSP